MPSHDGIATEKPGSLLGGLSALAGGLAGGIAAVVLIHRWLSFTTTSTIVAHYAAFIVGAAVGGVVGYWLRYVLLIACLAGIGWIIYGVFHG